MSLGSGCQKFAGQSSANPCPGGTNDISPTCQRWDQRPKKISPEGTADPSRDFSRPFGTKPTRCLFPTLKRWAIVACPSGTTNELRKPAGSLGTNPSGIGPSCPQRGLLWNETANRRPVGIPTLLRRGMSALL